MFVCKKEQQDWKLRIVLPAFHPPFAVTSLVSYRASFTAIITTVKNGDCVLHVTLDRLLFVTVSQGRKPVLIASWNFTNGEISICLTEAAGRYFFACDKATKPST
ncbi:unnamed protein product [Taenia asiatica]|uniref:ANAPC4_WD40 domain-containing protein n=1 Tax=Taenia asiatica TaxID=60517 RepID=A0A0R3WFJ4_TAEAS|nr:unnamed protein product [Taenia asiatica]